MLVITDRPPSPGQNESTGRRRRDINPILRLFQEYPTEPLHRSSAPRAEILLAGNLNRN